MTIKELGVGDVVNPEDVTVTARSYVGVAGRFIPAGRTTDIVPLERDTLAYDMAVAFLPIGQPRVIGEHAIVGRVSEAARRSARRRSSGRSR